MKKFWHKHSTECNEKEMMLDNDAEIIGRSEIPEILALLPDIRGKVILELGAGIGWVNLLGFSMVVANGLVITRIPTIIIMT